MWDFKANEAGNKLQLHGVIASNTRPQTFSIIIIQWNSYGPAEIRTGKLAAEVKHASAHGDGSGMVRTKKVKWKKEERVALWECLCQCASVVGKGQGYIDKVMELYARKNLTPRSQASIVAQMTGLREGKWLTMLEKETIERRMVVEGCGGGGGSRLGEVGEDDDGIEELAGDVVVVRGGIDKWEKRTGGGSGAGQREKWWKEEKELLWKCMVESKVKKGDGFIRRVTELFNNSTQKPRTESSIRAKMQNLECGKGLTEMKKDAVERRMRGEVWGGG